MTWQLMTQNNNIPEMTKCWGRNVLVLAYEIILEINVYSQLNENISPHPRLKCLNTWPPVDAVLQVWGDMALLKEVHHLRLDLRAYRLILCPFCSVSCMWLKMWSFNLLLWNPTTISPTPLGTLLTTHKPNKKAFPPIRYICHSILLQQQKSN